MSSILLIKAIFVGLFTGFAISIPMGPAGLESIRWTLTKGLKKGIYIAAGSLIADAIDIIFINFGLLSLIERHRNLETFLWLVSGAILIFIGIHAIRAEHRGLKEHPVPEQPEKQAYPLLIGFIINFTNPMTHFFWLGLSSTVMRPWRSAGEPAYFIYAMFMIVGMFCGLALLNLLAHKGRHMKALDIPGKIIFFVPYVITVIGTGLVIYGLILAAKQYF